MFFWVSSLIFFHLFCFGLGFKRCPPGRLWMKYCFFVHLAAKITYLDIRMSMEQRVWLENFVGPHCCLPLMVAYEPECTWKATVNFDLGSH